MMGRRAKAEIALDLELVDLPPELRWREWMGRVEAVIFASPKPATREVLVHVVGKDCNLDLLIDDIREELRGRPYELVTVAGGWRHQTRNGFAEAIRAATGLADRAKELSRARGGRADGDCLFSAGHKERDLGDVRARGHPRPDRALRAAGLIAAGPRSPKPGAPYAYVTTPGFLSEFGFESLRDLPDLEKLEDAGLLGRPGPDGADPGRTRNVDRVELFSGLTRALGDELEEDAA